MWHLHRRWCVLVGHPDLHQTALVPDNGDSSIVAKVSFFSYRNELTRGRVVQVRRICDSHVDVTRLCEVYGKRRAYVIVDPDAQVDARNRECRLPSEVVLDLESQNGWKSSGEAREEKERDVEILEIHGQVHAHYSSLYEGTLTSASRSQDTFTWTKRKFLVRPEVISMFPAVTST